MMKVHHHGIFDLVEKVYSLNKRLELKDVLNELAMVFYLFQTKNIYNDCLFLTFFTCRFLHIRDFGCRSERDLYARLLNELLFCPI